MQALTQGYLDLLVLDFQQFLVDTQQVALPFVPAHRVKHGWKVVGAAISDLIVLGKRSDIAICHSAELLQQLRGHLPTLQLVDELPQVLVSSDPDYLVAILEESQHDISEMCLALLLAAQLADLGEDVDTGLPDDPVAVVLGFVPVELEQPAEELPVDQLRDDWQLQNRLLLDLEANILAKRQYLQADKLLTQTLAEAFTHIAEQLHSHDPIILILVIMGHLDHMLQHEIPPILIVQLQRNLSDLLAGQLFDLP